jgi:hypothetical protein
MGADIEFPLLCLLEKSSKLIILGFSRLMQAHMPLYWFEDFVSPGPEQAH